MERTPAPGQRRPGFDSVPSLDGWWISRMPTDELVLVDGSTFFHSSLDGDVRAPRHGLFHTDIRHLSQWELRLDGEPLRQLTTRRPMLGLDPPDDAGRGAPRVRSVSKASTSGVRNWRSPA